MVSKKSKKKAGNKKGSKNTLKKLAGKLYDLMEEKELEELEWEEEGEFKLKLSRLGKVSAVSPAAQEGGAVKESSKAFIRSPMNGIFYRSPSPGSESFVEKGDEVDSGMTVCIIEAMKLMNEVRVESNCVIKAILVDDSSSVKVNQPLFEIEYQ